MTTRTLLLIALSTAVAHADPAPAPAPADPDEQRRLNNQVETYDWKTRPKPRDPTRERPRGLFVGANLAYAARGKLAVGTERMTGTADFPAAYSAELQAGYRLFRFVSVALAPQMVFNLRPQGQPAARELDVFVQTTGHLVLSPRWDFNAFLAPGYSVLYIPAADDASGLAVRWGAGPMYHLSEHISVAVELSQQIGFQDTVRNSDTVDMATSFVSLLAGIRLRQ
jgi:hypothetical protein